MSCVGVCHLLLCVLFDHHGIWLWQQPWMILLHTHTNDTHVSSWYSLSRILMILGTVKTKGHSPPTAISHLHLFQLASPLLSYCQWGLCEPVPSVHTFTPPSGNLLWLSFWMNHNWVTKGFIKTLVKLSYKPSYFHLTLMVHSHLMLSQC